MNKTCSRCGESKPPEAFWRDTRSHDGRQGRCALCANRRRREGPIDRGPLYVIEDRGYETPCWVWGRALDRNGYGVVNRADVGWMLAHRWVYEQHGGTYPDGEPFLDHLCRQHDCVNPAHLEPVTNAENLRRGRLARAA